MSKIKLNQVTIYIKSGFMGNVLRYTGTLLEHGRRDYAQYKDAPFVKFIPARKRNSCIIQEDYKPYLLIIEGTDTPEPEDICPPGGGMSKYASFDERWLLDFDNLINPLITSRKLEIVADYREQEHAPQAAAT